VWESICEVISRDWEQSSAKVGLHPLRVHFVFKELLSVHSVKQAVGYTVAHNKLHVVFVKIFKLVVKSVVHHDTVVPPGANIEVEIQVHHVVMDHWVSHQPIVQVEFTLLAELGHVEFKNVLHVVGLRADVVRQ
jgi:hypothetical protein